jgi:MSHA biogenesis protein MshQ
MMPARLKTDYLIFRSFLLIILLVLCQATIAQVPACRDVFPSATTPNAQEPNVLDLPLFPSPNDGPLSVGNNSSANLGPGSLFHTSISIGNGSDVSVNGQTIIYVQSNFVLSQNAEFNNPGDPSDLVILVYGNVSIGNNAEFNGILYAEGAISIANNASIEGAVTARGPISTFPNTDTTYDQSAVENADFDGLCNNNGGDEIDGAVFAYFMEEDEWTGASGEVQDSSGNGLDATAVGGAETVNTEPAIPGSPGTCRYGDFSTPSRRITASSSPLINDTDSFSIAAWVKTPASWQTNATPSLIAYGNTVGGEWPERYELHLNLGGTPEWSFVVRRNAFFGSQLRFLQTPIGNGPGENPLAGDWVHVVATYNDASEIARLYVNGGFKAQEDFGGFFLGSLVNANGGMGLMSHPGGQYDARGFIDEVYMFGEVLDAGEVSDLYQNTRPCDTGYDHIRLVHPATGLTCSESAITVQACADVDCTSLYPDPVEIDLTSPAANWIPDPVTFTGSTQVSLQYTPGGVVTLGAAPIDPAAANPTRCFTAGGVETNCEMEFFDSGFVIDVPDHVADSLVNGSIAAVRSDPGNPEQCVPGFDNETKDVEFWSTYFNPGSGSLQVEIDGSLIATASPGTAIPVAFDGNGVGQFQLRYPDVGKVAVNAEYVGSGDAAGLVMTGQGQFVARPARFTLDIPGNPAATDETGDVFIAAGRDFEITVAARNASDGITPNFGQESTPEGVDLELDLFAPSGGVEPGLVGGFGNFATDCNGNSATAGTACGEFSWPEVGIVSLNPRLASGAYLGTADVVGTQVDHVGRFIPDHFELGSGDIIDRAGLGGCSSSFTYIGERFDTTFTLYARNDDGNTTGNYDGVFAFLGGGDLNLSGTPTPDIDSETVGWMMGVGDASAQLSLPRFTPAGPYPDYEVTTAPVDSDGVSLASSGLIDSTELRFGRVVIDNAIGSELGPLELPWRTEYWDGSTWLVNGDDNCSVLDLTANVSLSSSGGDSGDGTASVSLGGGTTSIDVAESDLTLTSGTGSIHFTAPGSPGWVDALLGLDPGWSFLRDDLDDDGAYEDNPQARASFGLFDGNSQRIYIREIAPQ